MSHTPPAPSQPSFAERVIELERYMTGLPFGTLDSAIFTDLMKAIREQRAALEHVLEDDVYNGLRGIPRATSACRAVVRAVLAKWRIE